MRQSSADDMRSNHMTVRMRESMRDAMASCVIPEPIPQCPYQQEFFLRAPFEIQEFRIKMH